MNLWLWSLYFLPVSGALKILPAVNLEGELGGSVTFECPLPKTYRRIYLCRETAAPGVCATVVSNGNFAKKEYIGRVSLNVCRKKNLFLVEMTGMTENDSGVYACGVGLNTDRGKTQQITLSISKVLSRRVRRLAVRMRALEASQRPRLSQRPRMSQRPRSQNIYSACPRRARGADAAGERAGERRGPRAGRGAETPRARGCGQRSAPRLRESLALPGPPPPFQGFPQDRAGSPGQAPLPGPGATEPSAPPQVSEAPWFHAPSLKTSCEYVSCYHQPPAKTEDYDSDDYINVPCLTRLPSYPPRPRPLCQ
ncbi:immunoglobulin mu Fc receptor [Dugong dugon]